MLLQKQVTNKDYKQFTIDTLHVLQDTDFIYTLAFFLDVDSTSHKAMERGLRQARTSNCSNFMKEKELKKNMESIVSVNM